MSTHRGTPATEPRVKSDTEEHSAVEALRSLMGLILSVLEGEAGELTLLELRALVIIVESSPRRSTDLAAELSIDPSTASRLSTRLETRRIITAKRSRQSKREVQIALTTKGQQLLDEVLNSGLRELRRSLNAFDRAIEARHLDGERSA